MTHQRWEELSADQLERLLVERWLYRGGVLAAALTLAVLFTMVSVNGLGTLIEQLLGGALAVLTVAAAGVFVYLRLHDRRIFLLLQDRRRQNPEAGQ